MKRVSFQTAAWERAGICGAIDVRHTERVRCSRYGVSRTPVIRSIQRRDSLRGAENGRTGFGRIRRSVFSGQKRERTRLLTGQRHEEKGLPQSPRAGTVRGQRTAVEKEEKTCLKKPPNFRKKK